MKPLTLEMIETIGRMRERHREHALVFRFKSRPQSQPPRGHGVGDFLHAMIRRWFLADYTAGCQCADMVARMNRHGPAWCRENLDAITQGMTAEARRRGWRLARWRLPAEAVARAMIRRACRLAEKAAR